MDQNTVSHIVPAQFCARLAEFGIYSFGCSKEEITHIESRFGVRLPQAYKDFLAVMGKRCAEFASCESWEYYALSWVKQASLSLLELQAKSDDYFCFSRKRMISVPQNAFFFLAEIAGYCLFFNCDEGEDPPIYVVQDGDENFRQCFDSFSTCFSLYANQALEYLASKTGKLHADSEHDDDGKTFRRVFKGQEIRCSDVASRSLAFALPHYGVVAEGALIGCSEEEINDLEDDLGLFLPLSYRCFLEKLGIASPGYLDDCEWHLAELRTMQQLAKLMLRDSHCEYQLKETDFVFLLRDADLFLFFDTAEGDVNPPVFRYSRGADKPILVHASFTEWFNSYRSSGHGMEFAVEYEVEEPFFPLVELLSKAPGTVRTIDLSKMAARSKRMDARSERGYSRSRLIVELDRYSFRASYIGDDDEGLMLSFRWSTDTKVAVNADFLTITFPAAELDFQFSIPLNVLAEWQGQWISEIRERTLSKEPDLPYLLFGQFKYSWNPALPSPIHSTAAGTKSDLRIEASATSFPAMDVAVDFGEKGIETQILVSDCVKISYFFRWNWSWHLNRKVTGSTLCSPDMGASILLSTGAIDEISCTDLLQNYESIIRCSLGENH
ncbi:MAG: SMI1/KNR4 family protein [Candidatus Obscuribacterales bacterium]|jgi:hypothetical protein|nr:SMI1/KNR4 family protein [Candidatus Obscuribacterales bacterium]